MKRKATIILLGLFIFCVTKVTSQVQVDKFTGDASYGLPLITIPNFRGPSVSTSLSYKSDIKVNQPASEVGLGWNINAGGSVERSVNGVPDDWKDVDVPDMQAASFQKHLGALYFHSSNSSTVLDFNYTRYKMDTLNDSLKYYYPDYDTYYVTGAGMAGEIIPKSYDYPSVEIDTSNVNRWFYNTWYSSSLGDWITDSISIGIREIETYEIDDNYPFENKPQFEYLHNYCDTISSTPFPWEESPLTSSSQLHVPQDSTFTSESNFYGGAYNDENYGVTANQNRARTSNYIEYFTNTEIHSGVTEFYEYDTSFNRSVEADFPQSGIGAYRITDPNGYTYHYSLPVYAHYNTSGSVSLDKDYNKVIAEGGYMDITDSTLGYIVENDETHEILEIKQIKKYAIRWLLTAITGPDFEDSNADGLIDENDKGYWVKYDYGLWTESFPERFPYCGASYSYSSDILENIGTKFIADEDEGKITGKMLAYGETANQLYYLNEIKTPSHTGVFVRGLRYDQQSVADNLDYYKYTSTENLKNVTETIKYKNGEGTFSFGSELSDPIKYFRITINPDNVDSVKLFVDDIRLGGFGGNFVDTVRVFDGLDSTGTVLYERYGASVGASLPTDVTSSSNAITIEYKWTHESSDLGNYTIHWESKWANKMAGWEVGRALSIPQLKLSKLLLFDNDDISSLPSVTALDSITGDNLWSYEEVDRSAFYNDSWYEGSKGLIDSLALQSVHLDQDYSLAKGYHNNRFVNIETTSKTMNALEVEANKYVATNSADSSGKLTLNKVIYYGLNGIQTQPSHLFDYSASDSLLNPDYNPVKQDYWGNYKCDADSNLLRGYVTDSSETQIAAWSLRKVTSPLGGTTEIIYESDEYEQVLSEGAKEDLRGPIKTFALTDVVAKKDGSGNYGAEWDFELENQESEFFKLLDSLPIDADMLTVIPAVWVEPEDSGYSYSNDLSDAYNWSAAVFYGDATFSESPNEITSLERYFEVDIKDTTPVFSTATINYQELDTIVYSGGGFVEFQYPIGEKIKGGGTRVKELIIGNDVDEYKVNYSYNKGTATSEASDFSKHKMKSNPEGGVLSSDVKFNWIATSFDYNPFALSSQVGYGEVSVENNGQTEQSQGKSVFLFNVSNEDKNYHTLNINTQDTSWYDADNGICPPMSGGGTTLESRRFSIEIIDDFTSIWGKIKEQISKDINDNMVSKKVYEYEAAVKGADVSTINYILEEDNTPCLTTAKYLIGIRRTYPTYLKKVITYSNGRMSESEVMDRDVFTGDPIETKNTSINNTITREEILLAYTQNSAPDYTSMGAKSVDPSYDNFLNATYSSISFKEVEGMSTSDFSSYGKSFWKDTTTIRYYNDSSNEYELQIDTVNWYDYTKYVWTGPLGDYGLFDTTGVTNITSPPTAVSNWRMMSEITLMDEDQNVLEQKGYNDRFSASKLGYDNRFTYTSSSNSNYVSFTATGFETIEEVETGVFYFEGEVLKQTGNTQQTVDGTVYPHTGNSMVKISSSSVGPIYKVNYDASNSLQSLQRGRTYTASVWIHEDSPITTVLNIIVEGDSQASTYSASDTMSIANTAAIQIGDWIQLTVNVEVPEDFTGNSPGDGLEVYVDGVTGGAAWIDDMLFHSRVSGSGMNVYDQRTGRVLATLSDNNFATKYVYNDAGQVIEVWKEVLGSGWVKVESRDFNFKREMEE